MDKILLGIPVLMQAVSSIARYVSEVRAIAQQKAEWSAALEDEFQAMLESAKLDPAWQPDRPVPPAV